MWQAVSGRQLCGSGKLGGDQKKMAWNLTYQPEVRAYHWGISTGPRQIIKDMT
jgi:hypothetical protein